MPTTQDKSDLVDNDDDWERISKDVTAMYMALNGYEGMPQHLQDMLAEIMLRCSQRLTICLEDRVAKKK